MRIVAGLGIFLASCSLFQPTPTVTERNYETGSQTKMVKVGNDVNLNPLDFMEETFDHARQRLVADIQRECPRYQVLAEGPQAGSHVESQPELNVFSGKQEMAAKSVADHYLWIRYRCER
jgi:hypothetical protein